MTQFSFDMVINSDWLDSPVEKQIQNSTVIMVLTDT